MPTATGKVLAVNINGTTVGSAKLEVVVDDTVSGNKLTLLANAGYDERIFQGMATIGTLARISNTDVSIIYKASPHFTMDKMSVS